MSRSSADVRVRAVIAVGCLLALGLLVFEMSGSATRTAGSNHVSPAVFAATVPGGGTLCQPGVPLPNDAAGARLLVGTYGRPVPQLGLSFSDATGATVAAGTLASGQREGYVTLPLARNAHAAGAAKMCLHVGGGVRVVVGGEAGPVSAASEVVDGKPQPGLVSVLFMRAGSESWWQLLPTLARRFGLGKSAFFGTWTLPMLAVLLVAVWVAVGRLLWRELR